MTIEKGKEWGRRISRPHEVVTATSDFDLAQKWSLHSHGIFRLTGGDVFTALGCPVWDDEADEVQLLSIDVLQIMFGAEEQLADTTQHISYAFSSIEIGSWMSRGRYVCISNAGFVSKSNIAPRAHPNDGEMDVVTVSDEMEWKQRIQAWRRSRLGHHVPHPHIAMERGTEMVIARVNNREVLRVDGKSIGNWRRCVVRVIPDACHIVV
jgi:hypothetical protein